MVISRLHPSEARAKRFMSRSFAVMGRKHRIARGQ
jgi:hypothetical protein